MQPGQLKRRDFIAVVGGAVAWPLAARAQQRERMRRIGVLLPAVADNPVFQGWLGGFLQALALLGWVIGRNLQLDIHWATPSAASIRKHAAELAVLAPDVIVTHGISTLGPLKQATSTVPIVFVIVSDPVAAGVVESLARPGGNATGFTPFEYSLGGKWPELLKQIAPGITRVAVIRDHANPTGLGQFGVIQALGQALGMEVSPVNARDTGETEGAIAAFARHPNSGLIITPGPFVQLHRDLMVALPLQHKLPAAYFERGFVAAGGLISYGPDYVDEYRRAAGYVDRILRGEKPADLPVQTPTKYELIINLKTAKAIGLEVPPTLLARADEVIE